MLRRWQILRKWMTPGLGIKRWLILLMVGITIISVATAQLIIDFYRDQPLPDLIYVITLRFLPAQIRIIIGALLGGGVIVYALLQLNRSMLAPFARQGRGPLIDMMYNHSFRQRGIKLVALG